MTQKIWVLTREHNDYNQLGAYFVTAWTSVPSKEQLIDATVEHQPGSVSELLKFVLRLEEGGGRHGVEDVWFNLDCIAPGDQR